MIKSLDEKREALITAAIVLDGEGYPEIADFLRDTSPLVWRPTKEQIETLECAERWYSDNMGCNDALCQLLRDLKELKKEK